MGGRVSEAKPAQNCACVAMIVLGLVICMFAVAWAGDDLPVKDSGGTYTDVR